MTRPKFGAVALCIGAALLCSCANEALTSSDSSVSLSTLALPTAPAPPPTIDEECPNRDPGDPPWVCRKGPVTAATTPTSQGPPSQPATPVPPLTPTDPYAPPIRTSGPTATPGIPQVCPALSSAPPTPDFWAASRDTAYPDLLALYLTYLNAGGDPAKLSAAFDPLVDVTGDGVPELFLQSDGLRILSCSASEYEQVLYLPDEGTVQGPTLELLGDANNNGIPELIVSLSKGSQGGGSYDILEWSTQGFRSLALPPSDLPFKPYYPHLQPGLSCESGVSLRDFDNDGQQELVFCNGLPFWDVCANPPPWRVNWHVYEIDAEANYVPFSVTYSPPEFRFEALQDGDRLTLYGDYEGALRMYQDAIFSDKLGWWSTEREEFYCQRAFQHAPVSKADIDAAKIKSGQVLSPDPSEYPTIAAYARFRIMLLHIVRDWPPEADTVYNTLVSQYPRGSSGSQFADMATAFMDEYGQSGDIELACKAAVRTISPQDDTTFRYLGYEYQRYRSGILCPFGPLVPLPHRASSQQ